MPMPAKFDAAALVDAVDARRKQLGLTWKQLSEELHVSTSTIKGMPTRKWGIELDGVIGLCAFLGRTVESFAGRDGGEPTTPAGRFPPFPQFSTVELYEAVNEKRTARGLTWEEAGREIWPAGPWGADQLKRLAKGGRTDVASALAVTQWLGVPIACFVNKAMR
jgi:transcriptional regulator with XRE-family HTH domain